MTKAYTNKRFGEALITNPCSTVTNPEWSLPKLSEQDLAVFCDEPQPKAETLSDFAREVKNRLTVT